MEFKTLSEMKQAKEVKVKKTIKQYSMNDYAKLYVKAMQPEAYCNEYERINKFDVQIEGNKITLKTPVLYYYCLDNGATENEVKNEIVKCNNVKPENVKVTYFEKINRFLVEIANFETSKTFDIKPDAVEYGMIRFRSNDYIFINQDGHESYGESIKSENLIKNDNNKIIGFKMPSLRAAGLIYEFC